MARVLAVMCCLYLIGGVAGPLAANLVINEFVACNTLGIVDDDEDYSDWIELFNPGPTAVNTDGYGLSDDPAQPQLWLLPHIMVEPGEYVLVFASGKDRLDGELHTNFKLSSDGESVVLTDPSATVVDRVDYEFMPADISRGRSPDGGQELFYFRETSPAEANLHTAYTGFANAPSFSLPAGLYTGPQSVQISADPPGAVIQFSVDGTLPDRIGSTYTEPLLIDQTTALRACCLIEGLIPIYTTNTYIIDENLQLPVVSVVTDPFNLWDEDYGIYVLGDTYSENPPNYGANFWEDWERPAHLEYFTGTGEIGFEQDVGIKIHGGWTRTQAQKSLHLIPRVAYGAEVFAYPVFPDKDIDEFKRLVLRNAGNDWRRGQFRDALEHSTSQGWDLDYQAYSPVVVFLNGEYWGIQNLRERQDEDYLASNRGVDPNAVDMGINRYHAHVGSMQNYNAMITYIEDNGVVEPEHFAYIQTQMDTDNYATYNCFEIYYDNCDWPGWNIKFWRTSAPPGRWRWLLWDLDFGLGLFAHFGYWHNTLAWALDPDGSHPQTQPEHTFLLRSMMDNDTFRRDFINRYADLINTQFKPEVLLASLEEFRVRIQPEIARHQERWESTYDNWLSHVATITEYMQERPAYARLHIRAQFALPATATLQLDINPPGSGRIDLTAISINEAWSGEYFEGNPVRLNAVPGAGYEFRGWSIATLPQEDEIFLDLDGNTSLTAIFGAAAANIPVINEINYNSADDFDPGDWVELHNPGTSAVDIGGWQLRDGDDAHVFTLPIGTSLAAAGYLVLCRRLDDFQLAFPEVVDCLGDFDFGFSSAGEAVRLFDAQEVLVDQVTYGVTDPWPEEPNGLGPTLESRDPFGDNSQPQNWLASLGHGSPGALNSAVLVAVETPVPATRLVGAYPNPFNPQTRIRFDLVRNGRIQLRIYDVSGRLRRTLAEREFPAGQHEVAWDGKDRNGENVPTGVYLVRLVTGDVTESRKLVLLR